MTVVPCSKNSDLTIKINEFVDILKTKAHLIAGHEMTEQELYGSGLFRGSIEKIRGEYAADMRGKREFVQLILNHMQDSGFITNWESAGDANRHDYSVLMPDNKIAVIELKGCLDGNNTTIFERPPHAQEFIIWSVCTNPGSDPKRNVWSGIHARLSAEIISKEQVVDGMIVWDMACGTIGRLCPKLLAQADRCTTIGPHSLPPPCIYLFPGTIPQPRNNPNPQPHSLQSLSILRAFADCFRCEEGDINSVNFKVGYKGADLVRTTKVTRSGVEVRASKPTAIKRK